LLSVQPPPVRKAFRWGKRLRAGPTTADRRRSCGEPGRRQFALPAPRNRNTRIEMTTAARIPATMDSAVLPAPMQIARPDHRRQRHDQPWNEVEVVRPHGMTHFPDFAPVHPPLLGVQPDGGMERAGGRRRFFIQRARSRQVRIAVWDSV